MADKINIDTLTRDNLLKLSIEQLHEIKNYMVGIRQTLISKSELVAAVCEEKEETERVLHKVKGMPEKEREALKQVLNGDHLKKADAANPGQ